MTSVRDLAIHGDDLVVATFGRSFWILDNITPLRQALDAERTNSGWLYHPATAVRVDNDSFIGTPLPPEEPAAANPPNGAMLDYFLPSEAKSVQLEIFDAQQHLVRKFSSQSRSAADHSSPAEPTWKHQPLPVAERWFAKPETVERAAGMHRFVWNLTWASSGGPTADEEAEYRNPSGPKVVPGIYQVRLTVDGKTQTQSLKVVMDPRSSATSEVLAQQLDLGLKIFGETIGARATLAEIGAVQKQLANLQQKLGQQKGARDSRLAAALSDAQSDISKTLTNKDHPDEDPGLQDAYTGLASALRVVESGDRAVPSQAIAVYEESSPQVKARIAQWAQFKKTRLKQLNQQLHEANLAPIAIAGSEQP